MANRYLGRAVSKEGNGCQLGSSLMEKECIENRRHFDIVNPIGADPDWLCVDEEFTLLNEN